MSKFVAFLTIFLAVSESSVIPTRFRRQYGWGGSPYYGAAQYYETQPQQWSSQYQNNQNYYSPYFHGYQHQQTWQNSNQNTYQSQYNRPSWISENNNGYATAPPNYSQGSQGSYARPKYLATMQPKPTLSPVILERSTVFVTPQPVIPTENGRHPTFLERLGVATLPVEPTITSSEEETLKNAEEHETLGNGELLPERTSEEGVTGEEETTTILSTTEEVISSTTEPSVLEKDEIASSDFFASSTESTETPESSTMEITTSDVPTVPEIEETTESFTTTTEEVSSTEPSTTTPTETTTEESTTTTTTTTFTTTTSKSTTTGLVKDVKPVTLLAFQEITNEVTSNALNVTQPTVDQSTSVGDLNVIGEGSGSEPATTERQANRSTIATGIVGLRAPPVPKTTDPEKVGIEVVEWTDSDNEVRKVLLTQ